MTSAQGSDGHQQAPVYLDGDSLTVEEVVAVARLHATVRLTDGALERVKASATWVEETIRDGQLAVYGINTGFGPLAEVHIPPDKLRAQARNLILSHSVGVGPPLPQEVVRATMLIRANTLAKGFSGIRCRTLETLVEMLNRGVHPIVPEKGSVGASGDLAPLAHLVLPLIGEGEAQFGGRRLPGGEAMRQAGLAPVALEAKEGLALINGTAMMAALGCLALADAENLVDHAEMALGISLEALLGTSRAYDERLHAARNHPGQVASAANVRRLIAGSELMDAAQRVQDAYSLRCGPQVLGAARDTLAFVHTTIQREINAATDNPLIFLDEPGPNKAFSGGNFHGEPLALAMDFLGIAISEVGSIAERRIFRLLDASLNRGLPSTLTADSGLQSGLMLTQYTAAALVSDSKTLAHPDSVDSIPTGASQEDHVSMGPNAAHHARQILWNCERVVAIEFLCAAQAIDCRMASTEMVGKDAHQAGRDASPRGQPQKTPPRLGTGTLAAHQFLRSSGVQPLTADRTLAEDIEHIASLIRSRQISVAVWKALEDGD